jgi:hypothetical protein
LALCARRRHLLFSTVRQSALEVISAEPAVAFHVCSG